MLNSKIPQKQIAPSGAKYFIDGFSLVMKPGLRRFVFIPLLINLVLFSILLFFSITKSSYYIGLLMAKLPYFLNWLSFIIWPIVTFTVLIVATFVFSMVMNLIASPFNGILAEKAELLLTGESLDTTMLDTLKDLPRIIMREVTKFSYYLPRAIFFLILFVIPVIGHTVAPILWFLFSAWIMAIQYCDYSFDNHRVSFKDMKYALNTNKGTSISFGAAVAIFSMIPILNFVVMPVAVCGSTAMWVDKYKKSYKRLDR